MKIAIASSNGKEVNTHLGKSSSLYIYNFNQEKNTSEFLEQRLVKINPESKHQNQKVLNSIEDCEVVIVKQHGIKAEIYAKKFGIKIIDDEGSIEEVLERYQNHVLFMKNIKI